MMYRITVFILSIALVFSCSQQKTVSPTRREIVDAVFASGHIENESQYIVTANTDGYLQSVFVTEGDTVKTGQPLFTISNDVQETQVNNARTNLQYAETNTNPQSPQIEQLKIQIQQAADKASVDSANAKRYQRLSATHAVSRADYDNMQLQYQASVASLNVLRSNLADLQHLLSLNASNARDQLKIQQQNKGYNHIVSTAPGIVLSVHKKEGDYVKKGDAIAQISAGQSIIKLLIAEEDIERVQAGQTALVSLNSDKNKVYKATITKIYPSFDASQQSFIAEATFNEEPKHLLNGTQLQANIIIEDKKNALVIPSYYLINGDSVQLANKKQKTLVITGIRTLEWTEVTDGLNEKDVLVLPKQN